MIGTDTLQGHLCQPDTPRADRSACKDILPVHLYSPVEGNLWSAGYAEALLLWFHRLPWLVVIFFGIRSHLPMRHSASLGL